jgi:hypothetical protein
MGRKAQSRKSKRRISQHGGTSQRGILTAKKPLLNRLSIINPKKKPTYIYSKSLNH